MDNFSNGWTGIYAADAIEIVQAEERHLRARLDTVNGTVAILSQRIEQLNDEISGLKFKENRGWPS